jgi:uroporphyrinogen decarboxylase
VDILDPIQNGAGTEPEGLKKDFGDNLYFHGGIDTQNILPHGTHEQVHKEEKYFIRVLNHDGGYILGSNQDFEGDVPVENILALCAARDL